MKTPRFTDGHKYPNGYRKAAATDVRLTFRRERERLKAAAEQASRDQAEQEAKDRAEFERRPAPDQKFLRSSVVPLEIPPIRKLTNVVEMLFGEAKA